MGEAAAPAAVAASDEKETLWADRRLWLMLAFGFVSGLPLALSGLTLAQWLTESHVRVQVIGLIDYIGLPYTLKFLWAPVLDHVAPPGRLARCGRRRGWLLAVQPLLALACVAMAISDAALAPAVTIATTAVIAFFSATQDIAIDAWRIETFPARLQGAANAAYVWGYRVAMMVSGAGVLWAVHWLGWHGALGVIAALSVAAIGVTWLAAEPDVMPQAEPPTGVVKRVAAAAVGSLRDFLARPGGLPILAYVALFNLGEAMAGQMLTPFYNALGFNRGAIAAAAGPYTLVATMAGIGIGGWLVARLGVARALILTGFAQMAAMGAYVLLAASAGNHAVLYGTVVLEAFARGVATAAFLAYLSTLCSVEHTATQFALLTSVAPFASRTLGGLSGFIAAYTGWALFYTLAMLASLPAMLLMLYILRRYPPPERPAARHARR